MKTKFQHIAIAVFSIAAVFTSCKKEEIRPMPVTTDRSVLEKPAERMAAADQNAFENALCKGLWAIQSFNDGNSIARTDQTVRFRGYVLKFYPQHVVIAKSIEKNITAKWNTITVGTDKILVLDFGRTPFIMMNGKWTVGTYNAARIAMTAQKRQGTAILNLEAEGDMAK